MQPEIRPIIPDIFRHTAKMSKPSLMEIIVDRTIQ
jgi:hypothetical protein